jgi:hypothetical protein
MARISQEEMAERLADTAELMVRLRSSYQVERHLARKYGVNPRTCRDWMAKVRAARRAEASSVDVDNLRDDMRESLNTVAALALGRNAVVKNDDGTVVMTEVTRPDGSIERRPTYRANPDLQRALHALRELMHLDGLPKVVKHELKVDAEVTAMPDLKKLGPSAAKAMGEFLKELAGGDLSKLAGDWFKFSGEGTDQ